MEKISVAKIMKALIEEKEFFIYPKKEVKDLYDVILYKQSWLNSFYMNIQNESFLYYSLDYQKSLISSLHSETKNKNSFKKSYIYFVVNTKNSCDENCINKLKQLSAWVESEKIKANIIVLNTLTMNSIFSSSNFEDKQNLIEYFQNLSPYTYQKYEEINLLEVEKNTRIQKGYYLPNQKNYLTKLFMAINIIYFIYMTTQGGTTDIYNLIKFGAKYNPLIASGEYYRLFTNMFIHIGIVHLLLNTYALKILGKDSEAIYGSSKFLIIYIVSGIFGGLGSFIFSDAVSAGASGAIFGLIGSYLYFGIKKPLIFSARYGMNLIVLLVINIIFGLSSGNIDNFAHFGGLLGGFLTSWSLGLKKEKTFSPKKLFAQGLIILIMISLLFTGVQKHQSSWEYNFHIGIKYLQEEDFENAKSQFEIGIEKNKNISELYFYIALIHYYEGDFNLAIDYLNKTLSIDPNDSMAKELLAEIKEK